MNAGCSGVRLRWASTLGQAQDMRVAGALTEGGGAAKGRGCRAGAATEGGSCGGTTEGGGRGARGRPEGGSCRGGAAPKRGRSARLPEARLPEGAPRGGEGAEGGGGGGDGGGHLSAAAAAAIGAHLRNGSAPNQHWSAGKTVLISL